MYQLVQVKTVKEKEYIKRMSDLTKCLNWLEIKETFKTDPLIFISNSDELNITLDTNLSEAIKLLKKSDKLFFMFNGLMYSKLYAGKIDYNYDYPKDSIVIMNLTEKDVRKT